MNKSLYPDVRLLLTTMSEKALRNHGNWLTHVVLLFSDALLIIAGFALAYWMRYILVWPQPLQPIVTEVATENFVPFRVFLPITLLLVFLLLVLFETNGLYRLPRGSGFLDYAGIILNSTLTGIAILIVFVFLYRPFFYSRLIFAFAGLTIVVLLCLWRAMLLGTRHWCWTHDIGHERVLVVGGNGLGYQVMNGIAAQPHLGYQLVGYLDDNEGPAANRTHYPHLGRIDDLLHLVQSHKVDQVILALPAQQSTHLTRLVQICRRLGVEFRVAPDLHELSFDHVSLLQISGVPLIELKEVSIKGWNLAVKRALDVLLVLLSAPISVPLVLLIALIIRLDSTGSAFFRQIRVGKNGRLFTCYKFRTMVPDAEQRKAELAQLNEADGPLFKIRHDPRITRVGRMLRRSSLDELPQIWNVLRGEMSLVGPRPAIPDEVARYEPWHRRRLEVLPGLTGLWQVLGRSDTSFDEMVRLDIYYAENWSLLMDLSILLKTIPAVLLSKGAY